MLPALQAHGFWKPERIHDWRNFPHRLKRSSFENEWAWNYGFWKFWLYFKARKGKYPRRAWNSQHAQSPQSRQDSLFNRKAHGWISTWTACKQNFGRKYNELSWRAWWKRNCSGIFKHPVAFCYSSRRRNGRPGGASRFPRHSGRLCLLRKTF